MTETRERDFTQGGILLPLLRFALPVLLALLLQAMYGGVDLLVVGQFGSSADVSGVSTGSQLMQSVTYVITGLAMGMTILIGQKLGEKEPECISKVVGSGIVLLAAVAAAVTAVMCAAAPALARLMQAPEEAFSQTCSYIRICAAGTVFIVAYNLVGGVFRGLGDSGMPLITVAIACVFNIVGDLFFVAVLHMGAAGAALATVLAQALSVGLSLLIIRKRTLPFRFVRADLRPQKQIVRQILRLGTPIALQDLLVGISFLVLLALVNSMGLVCSAGMGVAEKLCAFIMLVPSAFMQSMSAFVAQNIGANRYDRARRALLCGIVTSVILGLVMGAVSFFEGEAMARIFSKDAAVNLAAAEYLRAYAIDCVLTPFLFCFIGFFNGCGKTVFVMLQGLVGAFCVRIPVAFLVSRSAQASMFHIGLSTPASSVVQILLCLGVFLAELRREHAAER